MHAESQTILPATDDRVNMIRTMQRAMGGRQRDWQYFRGANKTAVPLASKALTCCAAVDNPSRHAAPPPLGVGFPGFPDALPGALSAAALRIEPG